MLRLQKTVDKPASISGIGLHTGSNAELTLLPAPVNTGIVFQVQTDAGTVDIPALVEHVIMDKPGGRKTTLAKDDVVIHTVEHVLASLVGMGITNCYLKLVGQEPPVTSCSSALPYVELIQEAGIRAQGLPAMYYKIPHAVTYQEANVVITAEPADRFLLSFHIDYADPLIGVQQVTFEIRPDVFDTELAPARTFVLIEDVAKLQEQGLALGGSLENALVVENGKLAGGQTLRFPNEFVRHKVLDLLGDLALLGMPICGHVTAHLSGHDSNVAFTRMLAKQERRMARIYPPRNAEFWDIGSIMELMPHRYPFLLIDRIIDLEPGKRVVGIKNVTINEPFFQGHFPNHPIMPAVLITEAMAQAGGVLLMSSVENAENKLVYFSGIDNARFRAPVTPGDQLRFELELVKLRGPICKMRGIATVGGKKVAEADLMSSIVDR